MSLQDQLDTIGAAAELTVAKVLGNTLSFTARGGTPVTLYFTRMKERVDLVPLGKGVTEVRVLEIVLPGQTGLTVPPTGEAYSVTHGDTCTWRSRTYQIVSITSLESGRFSMVLEEHKKLSEGI